MPSTFFGLNIAASGLRAANAALNTTANNIANANTDEYSRQKVDQRASDALRVFTTYGCAGAGVDTIAIERVRDEFYDVKYRTNESLLGRVSQRNYFNELAEEYFKDDGTTGFSSLFSKMQSALQDVMKASGTTESKATFVSSLSQITDYFNHMSESLKQLQNDINQEIKMDCDTINSYAEQICSLNKQINIIEMQGSRANELRDQRDELLDKLSKIVNIEVKETKVVDASNPERETGATRLIVNIAGKQQLLDSYSYRKLVCIAREANENVNQSDIVGLYDIKWAPTSFKDGDDTSKLDVFDLDNKLIGGELQGLIDMRDGNNSFFFSGEVQNSVKDQKTGLTTVTIKVSDPDLMDMTKCTLPAAGKIEVASKIYSYEDWQYDGGDTYTFILTAESTRSTTPPKYRTATVGADFSYQGIPYYMQQMNEWIRRFSDRVNDIMSKGYTADSLEGRYILTGTSDMDSNAQFSYPQLTSLSNNKGYYEVTAGNFTVTRELRSNSDLLATKQDVTEGESEYRNIETLNEFFNKEDIFRGATSGEFLDKVLGDVALNTSNSGTLEETYTALEKTIGNQRLSVMGVDEDEEASALVQFEHSYTLNSKMINTLTEVYDRLITQTGV
ncbi:flagellar hook-associated protein 1 FlgK [Butyrivibrio sp. ob235]|uniref:flagellar hook-associated protein FlgK n=1 Tax=Butyrivibrio sp. ob235 TaxID=1761780 RepID=UPI0008AFAAD0|nr:flagellar hook-associated protein FlgK [Butyrivibrio sp. ob235]SEM24135.1 flagellar hook-associated protein 1 FlgK [Butyrivibrio sp. ob235]